MAGPIERVNHQNSTQSGSPEVLVRTMRQCDAVRIRTERKVPPERHLDMFMAPADAEAQAPTKPQSVQAVLLETSHKGESTSCL